MLFIVQLFAYSYIVLFGSPCRKNVMNISLTRKVWIFFCVDGLAESCLSFVPSAVVIISPFLSLTSPAMSCDISELLKVVLTVSIVYCSIL